MPSSEPDLDDDVRRLERRRPLDWTIPYDRYGWQAALRLPRPR
jgi:hypothetical protein